MTSKPEITKQNDKLDEKQADIVIYTWKGARNSVVTFAIIYDFLFKVG
jgi:hypothetical protein